MAPLMTLPLTSALSAILLAARISALIWLLLGVNLIGLPAAHAQDTQYISDMVLVPVRSGAARVSHRESRTAIGYRVTGIRTKRRRRVDRSRNPRRHAWLDSNPVPPGRAAGGLLINDMRLELEQVRGERDRAVSQLNQSSSKIDEADETIVSLTTRLESTEAELTEVKRLSAAALDLDLMNQQLVAQLESERSDADLLRLENVRLRERIADNQIMDGALAVLLGVILAVVAPRLWPKKKRQDGWS